MELKKEIEELMKEAKRRLTEEEMRRVLEQYKSSFFKTLSKEQQIKFKIICCWYEKLMEHTNLEAFDKGLVAGLTAEMEEDFEVSKTSG